jgi:sugar (pentulose or hexulose) kinase
LLEGVGFDVVWNVETFKALGLSVGSVRMIGGATKSRIWPQIVSDMLGLPVTIPKMKEAACAGAAILAGLGVGSYRTAEDGVRELVAEGSQIHPNEENKELYKRLFFSYKKSFLGVQEALSGLDRGCLLKINGA